MRPPSWMQIDYQGFADRTPAEIHVSVRIKKWHPGYWLFLLRALLTGQC